MSKRSVSSSKSSNSKPPAKRSKIKVPDDQLWFVIECGFDDSVCLVQEACVVYGETAKKGDQVKFSMTQTSKPLDGVIDSFSLDYDAMKARQEELNHSRKKKDDSFHEGKARKAAVAARVFLDKVTSKPCRLKGKVTTTNSKKAEESVIIGDDPTSPPDGDEDTINYDSDDSDTSFLKTLSNSCASKNQKAGIYDSDDDSSDSKSESEFHEKTDTLSDSELTTEELEQLKRLQAKLKLQDQKALRGIKISSPSVDKLQSLLSKTSSIVGPEKPKGNVGTSVISQESKVVQDPKGSRNELNSQQAEGSRPDIRDVVGHPKAGGDNVDGEKLDFEGSLYDTGEKQPDKKVAERSDDELLVPIKPKKSAARKKKIDQVPKKVFSGRMLNYEKAAPGLTRLKEGYDIFVTNEDLNKVKQQAGTTTAYARKLISAVFTKKAVLACSVSGQGRGDLNRPPLDPNGITAILKAAKSRSEKKGWTVPTDSVIKQKMNGKLHEDRSAYKGHPLLIQAQELVADSAPVDGSDILLIPKEP